MQKLLEGRDLKLRVAKIAQLRSSNVEIGFVGDILESNHWTVLSPFLGLVS